MEVHGVENKEDRLLNLSEARLFKVSEASDFLGISRAMLYELIASGSLRSVRIGGARRIPAIALTEFVSVRLDDGDRHTCS